MSDRPRLIEVAFPLEQTSLDSVHEKNVRHGHISTLHIWPARRPLAACRAALIATLLPDPGTPEKRRELCEKIAGKVVKATRKKKLASGKVEEQEYRTTYGGILHWGRETENKADIAWFREEIRKAYGGRAPKVLDPFAGGGAIPLEAMRLGCEVTASDINPVAWFILKCTLEYPQKLAGQKRRLPDFALRDREFMTEFFEAQGFKKAQIRTFLKAMGMEDATPGAPEQQYFDGHSAIRGDGIDPAFLEADLAWHVRAWGRGVLAEARRELTRFYPVYADFQPLRDVEAWKEAHPNLMQPMRFVEPDDDGIARVDAWNDELITRYYEGHPDFGPDPLRRAALVERYLKDETQPRWVVKPAVAYLWARTVKCKNCRAVIPLLKTRWLAKKDRKRVLLQAEPNADRTGVVFSVQNDVPSAGGNNAIRREHDRKIGQGTMSRGGAWCPCCGKPGTVAMEMEDIRQQGIAGRLDFTITAVIVDGPQGKEYRVATDHELANARVGPDDLAAALAGLPFGEPNEALPPSDVPGIRVPLYGLLKWADLFLPRQRIALGTIAKAVRAAHGSMNHAGYPVEWRQGVTAHLAASVSRLADYSSTICLWALGEFVCHTFTRFALPITWDGAEANPLGATSGNYAGSVDWVARVADHLNTAALAAVYPNVRRDSAMRNRQQLYDIVVTDPPYYGEIAYAALMDFFYVWLRRTLHGLEDEWTDAFKEEVSPKWDHSSEDGELIDDPSRFEGDREKSKQAYENGMAKAFSACVRQLQPNGRVVIVFANKKPDAWETLVSALIKAGLVVDGSWPIQTEREARMRAYASAALASSVWLVCRKRPDTARPGWDNTVLTEMRAHIFDQLRSFWDAGIHGPDFVWAATGPALEAYSKHPIVKSADKPGELMSVSEFLRAVRRIVVDFVVGRVLSGEEAGARRPEGTQEIDTSSLDDVTTYYLLHRHDFGVNDAPAGACILYAVSCNLSEAELADKYDILLRSGGVDRDDDGEPDEGDADAEGEAEEGTGSTFKLKPWKQRKRPGMGTDPVAESARWRRLQEEARGPWLSPDMALPEPVPPAPRMIPLIDQVHRLMHLWKAGDQVKVDQYLEDRGLRRNVVFQPLLQALIELSPEGSEERSVQESIMNHVRARGVAAPTTMVMSFAKPAEEDDNE